MVRITMTKKKTKAIAACRRLASRAHLRSAERRNRLTLPPRRRSRTKSPATTRRQFRADSASTRNRMFSGYSINAKSPLSGQEFPVMRKPCKAVWRQESVRAPAEFREAA